MTVAREQILDPLKEAVEEAFPAIRHWVVERFERTGDGDPREPSGHINPETRLGEEPK